MRIDKFLSDMKIATRRESAKLSAAGKISVNGIPVKKSDIHIDPEKDEISVCGKTVTYKKYTYIMLNKPEGYVSATEDGREKTVIDLLDETEKKKELFPCGRLDKNTLGLVILTNDGDSAHKLLSPKHHVSKVYVFKSEREISENERVRIENGVDIGGYFTKPCRIVLYEDKKSGEITLTEGKYHQIKRMLEAVNNKIIYLERIKFGEIELDKNLERGKWRHLTEKEEQIFTGNQK